MKRIILCTTALTLVSGCSYFGLPANVDPGSDLPRWEVRIGGYMNQYVAYADSDPKGDFDADTDFDGVDSKQDAEIHFLPRIQLDNGLTLGADVQLEGNTEDDQIDESFLYVDGSFGRVLLGSENSAGYLMHYAAPDVSLVGVNSGDLLKFVPFGGEIEFQEFGDDIYRGTLGSTFLENARNRDAQRITYFSPRFAGFQLGLSYARDGEQDNNSQIDTNEPDTLHDIFDIGANYVNTFGDFSVAASARYGWADVEDAEENPEIWSFGLNLGYAGVTIGGSFAEQNDTGFQSADGEAWDVGLSYETGPWAFSATYFHGENQNNELPDSDEELDQFMLAINYTLARGVNLQGFGAYVDFKENDDPGEPEEIDGFVLGTAIGLTW